MIVNGSPKIQSSKRETLIHQTNWETQKLSNSETNLAFNTVHRLQPKKVRSNMKDVMNSDSTIGSMGLVYSPTWMVYFFNGKCRQTYRTIHGSYGISQQHWTNKNKNNKSFNTMLTGCMFQPEPADLILSLLTSLLVESSASRDFFHLSTSATLPPVETKTEITRWHENSPVMIVYPKEQHPRDVFTLFFGVFCTETHWNILTCTEIYSFDLICRETN